MIQRLVHRFASMLFDSVNYDKIYYVFPYLQEDWEKETEVTLIRNGK